MDHPVVLTQFTLEHDRAVAASARHSGAVFDITGEEELPTRATRLPFGGLAGCRGRVVYQGTAPVLGAALEVVSSLSLSWVSAISRSGIEMDR